ncbi:hypothetical protein [Corynebacterium spheniscorum]|uniref:PASTA domain-containing protein n=1 Tax=Corynebacterium spheniscorum TaxID=185761 RepID=A0A1I2RZR6_9CORY|nr:hypothetical protein [Corynebacterium spheniscorum]KAA8720853.1 hypothetical protein F4V56_06825 [Corynebacterium spheniscorum]SFG45563.1 hypothetical protein SAMN05660282_00960 [Corynebacterium spheniscorum]
MTALRKTLLIGTTGLLAIGLSACTPPGEVDSTEKVDTAQSFSAPTNAADSTEASSTSTTTSTATTTTSEAAKSELPGYINCVGSPSTEPDAIALSCLNDHDSLKDINWSKWTADEAVGVGTREVNDCSPNCQDGQKVTTENVKVVLSEPTESSQGLVFTQVEVDDVRIEL